LFLLASKIGSRFEGGAGGLINTVPGGGGLGGPTVGGGVGLGLEVVGGLGRGLDVGFLHISQ